MYDILSQPISEIILMYIMFLGASLITFPLTNLFVKAAKRVRG